MSKRTGAGLIALAMLVVACGGSAIAFNDLDRAEQLAFDVFDELGTGLSEPELACIVRSLDEDGVLLPRDHDDLVDFETSALATSEVEDCADDPRDVAALIAAVREVDGAVTEEEPEEPVEDEPDDDGDEDEGDDEGDDAAEPEDDGEDGDGDGDGDGEASDISAGGILDTDGEPGTVTSLSPALLAAAEGSDPSGLETALDVPSVLVPSDTVVFYDAQSMLSFMDGEISFGTFDIGFFAEDTGDDGQRFLDAILDEEFSIDSETSVTQDDIATEIYELSRGRDTLRVSVGQGGDFEGILAVEFSYSDGTGQAVSGTGSEHGWVNSLNLPGSANVTRISSGYRPPFVSFFEPRLQLVRSLSADIAGADVDAFVELVADGGLVEDLELRVERETGDLEDGLTYELRTSRDEQVRVSLFPSSLDDEDLYRLSVEAPVELTDLDPGVELDDAPEPEDV